MTQKQKLRSKTLCKKLAAWEIRPGLLWSACCGGRFGMPQAGAVTWKSGEQISHVLSIRPSPSKRYLMVAGQRPGGWCRGVL